MGGGLRQTKSCTNGCLSRACYSVSARQLLCQEGRAMLHSTHATTDLYTVHR